MKKIKLQAHRGVSTDYPENTMSAFRGSVEQGYDIIELDPAVTADGEIIIMHDSTLNRTGRKRNGGKIEEEKRVIETTYSEIQQYEFGSWFDEKFAGEKAPLLQEVLFFAEETRILLKIDNKFERFEPVAMEKFLNILKETSARIAFTSSGYLFIHSPVIKKVTRTLCFLRMERMLRVSSFPHAASKLSATFFSSVSTQ